jgi:hypothetical protein
MTARGITSAYKLGKLAGIHPGIVSHLLSQPPRRDTCSPASAAAIEAALGVPHGSLFVVEMSPVSSNQNRGPVA